MMREAGAQGNRHVAVSGVGAVSGFGWGIGALWQGLCAGSTAIRPVTRFDSARHRTRLAAEVPAPARESLDRLARDRRWERLSFADRFAVFSVDEALRNAGLGESPHGIETGVFFGSSTGGMYEGERFLAEFFAGRFRSAHLRDLATQQVNCPGDAVARWFGATGPVRTQSSACASGALAIGAALEAVRAGEVELAIAGASDSLCELTYAGFNALRSVDEHPCRPFRAARQGMSLGEGCGVLIVEPLERALGRNVQPLAVLAGAGAGCDAHHMTAPEPSGDGAAAAIEAALRDAGLHAADVSFVNAHGTGTPLNDVAEYRALERVFGTRAGTIPVAATKALLGHLLGAAGAVEAVATVLCLHHGMVHPAPPCASGSEIDPAAPVRLVTGSPLPLPDARAAVSTSLAFGGSNAALVFSRFKGRAT